MIEAHGGQPCPPDWQAGPAPLLAQLASDIQLSKLAAAMQLLADDHLPVTATRLRAA